MLKEAEAILQASTSDLRELAILAGQDPRTMYIGTCMNGVDVRGQDLRGMIFTNLDRTKVRSDERTRWPDDLPDLI